MAFNGKIYVGKAVQTFQIDQLAPSPDPSQRCPQNLQGYRSNHDEGASISYHSKSEGVAVDAAYTYSECLSHNLESSSSSQSRHYRPSKPAQLPCNRPSRVHNQGKRVVSFPEAAALKSLSGNLSIPAHDGPSLRVVSLPGPELESNANLGLPGSAQDNLSSSVEYLDSSLDTSYHSSGTGSVHINARSFPPSDVPTTPSPPSSPESVLVIGNESRVSKAFLRQCSLSSSKTCDAEDEAGWIAWASSPPRPIPALHGPLSLPYARCPSGAEGTIIEDADLPRMIWGLDLEDTQSNTVREAPPAMSPQPDTAIVDSSKQVIYDSTHNSQSIRKHLNDKASDFSQHLENTFSRAQHQPFASVSEFPSQAMHEVFPDKPRVWDDTPIDIHKLTPYARRKTGIDPLQTKKTYESPSMSSAFVPAPRHRSSPSMTPRIFIEPRPGSQINPGPRLSAIEIAQRYRAERQQSTLPLSRLQPSSPTWSPTASLNFPALDASSSQFHYEHTISSSFDSGAHTGSSKLSGRDIPAEACPTEVAHREFNNIVNLPNASYSDPSFNSRMNSLGSSETPFIQPSPALDMSLILKGAPPTVRNHSRSQDTPSSSLLQRPNAPQARPRLLQGPRIQSIPMTRLIQRRLSSVAEEDSSYAPSTQSARLNHNNPSGALSGDDVKTMQTSIIETGIGETKYQEDGLDRENKENATESVKGAEKTTVKKKWRSRKRVGIPSLNLNQKK